MTELLVLQHIACEPPGAYEDELVAWQAGLHRVEVDEGEPIPDWRKFGGIIVMGGPMGAYQEDELPWLSYEKQLLADAVASGAPVWGVCLGAQLLAASLGARVGPGGEPEVGVLRVRCTEAARTDPVFSDLPPEFKALQWHGDTYDLPEGAVQLARSDSYEQQAFVAGRAYALQFHLEVTSELATRWGDVPAYARSLESIMGEGALRRLIADVHDSEHEMTSLARGLFARWLERVVGLERPVAAPA